jgi:hypothetical protein
LWEGRMVDHGTLRQSFLGRFYLVFFRIRIQPWWFKIEEKLHGRSFRDSLKTVEIRGEVRGDLRFEGSLEGLTVVLVVSGRVFCCAEEDLRLL